MVMANSTKKNSDRLDRRVVVGPADLAGPADLVDPVDPIGKVAPKARAVQGVLKNSNLLT
jgi:hypothetical protein